MSSTGTVTSARAPEAEFKYSDDAVGQRPRAPEVTRGEMARRFREFDWSSTPIGPAEFWPESWRNAVHIILDSSFPTALAIGKDELIYFYNDAFIPLAGPSRHPSALGKPVPEAWKEIWEAILLPRFTHTLSTGEPTGEADLLLGGEAVGAKTTAPNELRGGEIKGGETVHLRPGDVIHIPAGIPHQLLMPKGHDFTYFVVKVDNP